MYSQQRLAQAILHVEELVLRYRRLLAECDRTTPADRRDHLQLMLRINEATLTCLLNSDSVLQGAQRRLDTLELPEPRMPL